MKKWSCGSVPDSQMPGHGVDVAVRRLHRQPHFRPVLQDAVQVRRPLREVVLDRPEHPLRRVGENVRRVERLVHEERVRVVARGEQQILLLLVRLLLDLAPLDVDVGLVLHHVEELQTLVRIGLVGDHRHHLQGDLLGSHRIAGVGIDVGGRHPGLLGGAGERSGRSQGDQDCRTQQHAKLFHGFSLLDPSVFGTPNHGRTTPSRAGCRGKNISRILREAGNSS